MGAQSSKLLTRFPESSILINIRRLKDFVAEKLPTESSLRYVIIAERDDLRVDEFLLKLEVWMKLLRIENYKRG